MSGFLDLDVEVPFPAFPPVFANEFALPLEWLLQNGTSLGIGAAPAAGGVPLGGSARAMRLDREAKERVKADRRKFDGRRGPEEIAAEHRAAFLAPGDAQACLECERVEAICAADASALKRIEREWTAIALKRRMLVEPHSAAVVVKSEPGATAAAPAPLPKPVHPAALWCDRLCTHHQACLLDAPAAPSQAVASAPAASSSTKLPRAPIPSARLTEPSQATSWAALDDATFREMYMLPPQSDGPPPPELESASAASIQTEPQSLPSPPRKKARGDHGESLLTALATDDAAAAGAASSGTKPKKAKKSFMIDSLHIGMAFAPGGNNDLPVPMVDDSGRRSSRVQLLQQEQKERAAQGEREAKARKLRLAEEAKVSAELAAITRLKDSSPATGGKGILTPQMGVGGSSVGVGAVSAALLNFPALMDFAAPDALIHHKSTFSPQPRGLNDASPTDSKQPLPPLHLCMRILEAASFVSNGGRNLSKSSQKRVAAPHVQALTLNILRQAVSQEKKLSRPISHLAHSLLTPDVLGLPLLHGAIRLGHLAAMRVLLTELPIDDFSTTAAEEPSEEEVRKAPLRHRNSPNPRAKAEQPEVVSVKQEPVRKGAKGSKRVKVEADAPIVVAPVVPAAVEDPMAILAVPSLSVEERKVLSSQRVTDLRSLVQEQLALRETTTGASLTPLLYALQVGAEDGATLRTLELLVEAGANTLDTDAFGRDAAHWATLRAFPRCLEFILAKWPAAALPRLLGSQDDRGNTPLHYATASAMDSLCAGCAGCVRLYVRTTEVLTGGVLGPSPTLSRSSSGSGSALRAPIAPLVSQREVPLSSLPPFLLATVLRLQALLRNRVLHTLVRQTLWKAEVRLADKLEREDDTTTIKEEEEEEEESKHQDVISTKQEDGTIKQEDVAMIDGSSPSPSPASFGVPTFAPECLPPFFVSLLRLWRTLVHREVKLVTASSITLSPVVGDLASLLPLGLLLEPPGRSDEDQLVLTRRTGRCTRSGLALQCVLLLANKAPEIMQRPNRHGLSPADLVRQWSDDSGASAPNDAEEFTSEERAKAGAWREHVRAVLGASLGPAPAAIKSEVASSSFETPMSHLCAPLRYLQSPARSTPDVDAHSLAANGSLGPCAACGAGCLPLSDPSQRSTTASGCVCFSAPAFSARSKAPTAADKTDSILVQGNLGNQAQREQFLLPVLNLLDASGPVSSSLKHTYTRCAIFCDEELAKGNAIGQPTSDTLSCGCSGPCSIEAACPCSQHRFGTGDPIANDAKAQPQPLLRPTTTTIFECQPLCQCNCVLGGPDVTDVQRFHLRYRTQLVRHASGWRVHALEAIPRGSFVMEYACEVLTSSHSGLRAMEYGSLARSTPHTKFVIKIVQGATNADADNKDAAEKQRRTDVLETIAFDASRFGTASSFLRHGCSGTLSATLFFPNGMRVPKVWLHASRDIQRGEELQLQHDPQDCIRAEATGAHARPTTLRLFTQ